MQLKFWLKSGKITNSCNLKLFGVLLMACQSTILFSKHHHIKLLDEICIGGHGRVWKYATQPRNIYKVLPTKWKTSWVKKAGYYLRDSSRRCNQMVQSDFDWMFASGHNTSKTKAWNGRNIPLVWCLLRHPTWEISHLLKKPSPFIEILRQSM